MTLHLSKEQWKDYYDLQVVIGWKEACGRKPYWEVCVASKLPSKDLLATVGTVALQKAVCPFANGKLT